MDQFERACDSVGRFLCGADSLGAESIVVRYVSGVPTRDRPTITARISGVGTFGGIQDEEMNVLGWRRFGEAIKRSNKIIGLRLELDPSQRAQEIISPEAAGCLQSFFEEIKENVSILSLKLMVRAGMGISMSALLYFLRNNQNLRDVHVGGRTFSSANNEGFEEIISACRNVQKLNLYGLNKIRHFTYLAEVLCDPTTSLQELDLDVRALRPGADRALGRLLESLAQNTHLKLLKVDGSFNDDRAAECFETLLCNTATIESVIQSNHSLEIIDTCQINHINLHLKVEEHCQQYLELNENPNKIKVAQAKLLQFYFSGDFDTSSLANMNLAVLAQILGMDVQKKQSAMFNILKNIPELCAVSSRGEVQVD